MTQPPGRLFDEIAKLLTNAAGAANSVRGEFDALFRAQAERMLNDLDLVPREEFDAVKEMASKARLENEALQKRLEELETRFAGTRTRAKKRTAKPSKTSA